MEQDVIKTIFQAGEASYVVYFIFGMRLNLDARMIYERQQGRRDGTGEMANGNVSNGRREPRLLFLHETFDANRFAKAYAQEKDDSKRQILFAHVYGFILEAEDEREFDFDFNVQKRG